MNLTLIKKKKKEMNLFTKQNQIYISETNYGYQRGSNGAEK